MRIISLELKGYRRFALNSIQVFKIVPEQVVQLIIGTNGCGKSSLIRELTPLPADSTQYSSDGYKIITISKDNSEYVLKSTFSPVRHSFIKDLVELNPGGTVTVFRDLVRSEFNITNEIHELLIGGELFHSMSPARRRDWFTKLSDVNYDYALSIFSKLKEKNRDISGALKIAKNRYTNECSKQITDAEEDKLRTEVNVAHSELNLLLEQNSPLTNSVNHYSNLKQLKLDELEKLSTRLLRMKCVAPYGTHPYGVNISSIEQKDEWGESIQQGFNSVVEIEQFILTISHNITGIDALLNNAINEHSKITNKIDILKKTGKEGVVSLLDRLNNLRLTNDGLRTKTTLGLIISNAKNTLSAFDSVYDNLINVATSIPTNDDKQFSSVNLNELMESLFNHKNDKLNKENAINALVAKRDHLESHKNTAGVACPNCSHKWVPGYSEEKVAGMNASIDSLAADVELINKTITDLDIKITANKEYGILYNEYIKCVKSWPILKPLWDYLIDSDCLRKSPRLFISNLDAFRHDVELEILIETNEAECIEVKELIRLAEEVGDANLNELQSDLAEKTIYIESETAKLGVLRNSLATHTTYRKHLIESFELRDKINELVKDIDLVNVDEVEMMRRETLGHCIRQLQSSLALKESSLNAITLQKAIIADLAKQIETLSVEETASKILVQRLSPVEGLIAEGLLGFINYFTNSMNALMKKIWSYPLVLHACDLDEGELSYRFPVSVQTKGNIIPDVKAGSTGMRELFDLAFRIVAMKFLHLTNCPLYLDEYSASLDEVHKKVSMDAIKYLMDTNEYSQLYMVSHSYATYGVFTNSDICVLNDLNITVPEVYNKHVTMS